MHRLRLFFLLGVFFILFGTLGAQLYHLQVTKEEYYVEKVEALEERNAESLSRRGEIFITDRNGNKIPVALNKNFPMLYAVPREIENPEETAEKLAPIIGWEKEELQEAIGNSSSLFRLLLERAEESVIQEVEKAGVKGIKKGTRQARVYPFRALAAHVLGFVGINEKYDVPRGLYGIEKKEEKNLWRAEGVELTLDRNIQARSEEILSGLMETFNAKGGTIIVAEPSSGKILAMASEPTFEPNLYGKFPVENFINPATQSVYEPGSVMKPLTMVAGIDTGVITPETTYYDSGSVTLNEETIRNWDLKAHGKMSMKNVIEESINTGAVFAAQKTGKKNFVEYLKKFGFGKTTGIDLPDEVAGTISNVERKNSQDIDIATASFGQGISLTPIELISAFGSIANGGRLMRPYVNAASSPHAVREVMKKETAVAVTAMMESAVNKAAVASLPKHRIAGKTGTAEIADLQRGGYREAFNHTYVGFGPVSNPRFVALLKLEEPEAILAGATVVPAFRELASFIISYYNIPPDKNIE
ncbi:MAG: penicillin-binding protein 2 [Patescibacteria group bacterium]